MHRASRWGPVCRLPATLGWRLQCHLRCRGILGECLASVMFYVWSCDPLTQVFSVSVSFSFLLCSFPRVLSTHLFLCLANSEPM